jgi:hypothetical protein
VCVCVQSLARPDDCHMFPWFTNDQLQPKNSEVLELWLGSPPPVSGSQVSPIENCETAESGRSRPCVLRRLPCVVGAQTRRIAAVLAAR